MSVTSKSRLISRFCFVALLVAAVTSARAYVDPPIAAITDQYPVTEVLAPGMYGPPAPDCAKVNYEDDNGMASWEADYRQWDAGYAPTGPSDQGGGVNSLQFDAGNGDNTGKTKYIRPANQHWSKGSGAVGFCFHTRGYPKNNPYLEQKFECYTGVEFYNQ